MQLIGGISHNEKSVHGHWII